MNNIYWIKFKTIEYMLGGFHEDAFCLTVHLLNEGKDVQYIYNIVSQI